MGNYASIQLQKKKSVCGGCLAPAILDRDELAIHKEVGVPKGRLCIEAMKFLNPKERSLMLASGSHNSNHVQKLIKSGAPADTYDENRTSPLHVACRQGSIEVVKELLDHRAAIDITDCAGWTALHIAAFSGRADVVALLLGSNADATIVNRNGETPWDLASDASTQQEFISYWKQKSEETESPKNQSAPKTLYDITAKRAFPRPPLVAAAKNKAKVIKKWDKIGEYRTGILQGNSDDLHQIGCTVFNNNPYVGLAIMILFRAVEQIPQEVAAFLYKNQLSPLRMGELISDTEVFYSQIAEEYMKIFPFKKNNLIDSLRKLMQLVNVPMDNKKAARIMKVFAREFWTSKSNFKSKGAIQNLALSTIMLDFSLHDPTSVPMSKAEFIVSAAGMHDGEDFSEKYLSWVFDEVRKSTLRRVKDYEDLSPVFMNEQFSGHFAYKCNREWKEKYFVLKYNILWSFTSNSSLVPYSIVVVQGLSVHFDTRLQIFTISSGVPFSQLKILENGLVYVHMVSRIYFKAGNLKLWLEGFQSIGNIKITIV